MKYIITGKQNTGKSTLARHLLPNAIIRNEYPKEPKGLLPNATLIIKDIENPEKLADILKMAYHENDSVEIAIVTQIPLKYIVNNNYTKILDKFKIIKL